MKAAVLTTPSPISESPLRIEDVPIPEPPDSPGSGGTIPDYVLLRVRACGVCRTDLHIVEGELQPRNPRIIPGHQIVGEVVAGNGFSHRTRVGVSWIGGVDGTCSYCRRDMENLCDFPTFTGYTVDGGYAEHALA